MNISSILNGVSIGKDTSGNFRLTPEGVAVRTTADGKFFVVKRGRLLDVSELTFDGAENYIYRLPVPKNDIEAGDLIITSENPFSVLFVQRVEKDGTLKGIDPGSYEIKESVQPTNIFVDAFRDSSPVIGEHFLYVKVVSLIELPSRDSGSEAFLPLLLLGNSGGNNANPDDSLTALLIAQALGGKAGDNTLLPFLFARGGSSGSLENLLLVQALFGATGPLSKVIGRSAPPRKRQTTHKRTKSRKPSTASQP